MSETSMVNFRMDTELKRSMESVCKEMGLTMTTAFTMFAAKVSRERRIPIEKDAGEKLKRASPRCFLLYSLSIGNSI